MNRLYLKQIPKKNFKKNHKETETDCRKSNTEIHCIKPQIRDHSNNVPTSKDFKRSIDFSTSSKVQVFHSLQISHIKQADTIFQTEEECIPK